MAQRKITLISNCRWWAKMTRRKGSSRLYIKLFYHGRTIEKTTGLKDNETNREFVQNLVNAMNLKLIHKEFIFAEAFHGATEEDKKFFAEFEGYNYQTPPSEVSFGEVCRVYVEVRLPTIHSSNQKNDYMTAINPHILPFFKDIPANRITNEVVRRFFASRFRKNNPDMGLLTAKRMKNIRSVLDDIWKFMIRHYEWDIPDPFFEISSYIDEITRKKSLELKNRSISDPNLLKEMIEHEQEQDAEPMRRVIFFRDFQKILQHLDPFYRPAAEMMLLTGLSPSEMAGLHIEARQNNVLRIRWSLTGSSVRNHQKSLARTREIPLTKAINRVLDAARNQNPENAIFFFLTKRGRFFNEKAIREAWYNGCDKAGLKRCCPYSLRHCFVAYCEQMQINPPRLIGLMGHADKSMIDTVYGKYPHGLEKELAAIKDYYGEDFWRE